MISLEKVTKKFRDITAVNEISFQVKRGEIVGFLGPNAAGKTTTMRIITGYLTPTSGKVTIDGKTFEENEVEIKERIGYLPENNPLYQEMTVEEYLDWVCRIRGLNGLKRKKIIDSAVSSAGIEPVYYKLISEISKGYKQRVGIAQAIIHQPDILILDEPTEGLDPNQRVEMRKLIRSLGKNRTIILSTHVLPEVKETCNRVIIIHKGKIVADGTVDSLVSQAKKVKKIKLEIEGKEVVKKLEKLKGIDEVEKCSQQGKLVNLSISVKPEVDPRREIFYLAKENNWVILEMHQEEVGLEEVFSQLTQS